MLFALEIPDIKLAHTLIERHIRFDSLDLLETVVSYLKSISKSIRSIKSLTSRIFDHGNCCNIQNFAPIYGHIWGKKHAGGLNES
jgi:hypothetical protein